MAFCRNCGAELLPEDRFCTKCGTVVSAPPMAPAPIAPAPAQTFSQPYVKSQAQKGVDDLRNAFILYMVSGVLNVVPFVGAVSGILEFIALIFFIIGLRALGRSTLAQAPRYWADGRWFIYAIVIAIVIVVVGVIGVAAAFFVALGSVIAANPSPNFQDFFTSQIFETFFAGIFAVAGAASIPWLYAWYRAKVSMQALAGEISRPKVGKGGSFLFYGFVFGFAGIMLLVVLIFTGATSLAAFANLSSGTPNFSAYSDSYLTEFTGWGGLAYVAIFIVGNGVTAYAGYQGYSGLKDLTLST